MGLHWRSLLTLGVLAVSVPLIVGCGKYEKILKGTDAELQYKMALEYYKKGKYSKAQSLFERCVPVYRVTQRADSLGYYLSDCYFHTSSYVLAGFSFDQLVQNYPRSPFAEDAEFMSAYCLYKASPRPELDQEYTLKAIAGFEHFVEQHPMSTRTPEANTLLKELYGKLLTKSYNGAYQYYWQRNYRAAVAALQQSLLDYPITPYREEQMYLLTKSAYLLAVNSVESKQRTRYQNAVDHYLSFISEFPNSKHRNEVSQYYVRAVKALGETPNPELIR